MPLDIAAGIFISLVVAHGFGIHASAGFILLAIFCVLLPDIDSVIPLLRRIDYDHRSFFHWPLLYVPIAALIYFFFGPLIGSIFSFGILAHFIHDSLCIGWGVAWLAPFSMRKILVPEKGRRQEYGWLMTWLPHEEAAMAAKWHDEEWLKHWYFRPTVLAFIEYGFLLCSIIVLAAYYRYL